MIVSETGGTCINRSVQTRTLEAEGVLVSSIDFETLRFVMHHEVSSDDIKDALDVILKVESEIPDA